MVVGAARGTIVKVIRRCCFVVALLLPACSKQHSPPDSLPALPKLDLATYRPQVRGPVEKAYLAVQAKPADADANGNLGMLLHAFEQLESAEICYRRARMLDPQRFQWAYYLGLVQALDGKNEDAAASLREALRIDPGYVPARIKLAEVLLSLGRLDESREICQSILKDNPQVSPAYYWLGRVAAANGQIALAEEQYRESLRVVADVWHRPLRAGSVVSKNRPAGGCSASHGRLSEVQGGRRSQPEDPMLEAVRSLDNSALAHLMKGVDFENAGQIEQAIAEHEEAVRQDPKLVQAHANLIGLYGRSGHPEKAEQAYRAVVAINPNLPQSHYDYGVFLISRQRFPEAESAFRKALESSPNYAEAHSNLGAMLERRGKLEEALRQYQAAIENKPNFRQAQYQLGHLLLMQHKTTEAIAHLSQTLTPEDGDTPRFMYALGVAYAESGDFASSGRYLQQAGQRAAALGQEQLAEQIRAILMKVEQRAAQ